MEVLKVIEIMETLKRVSKMPLKMSSKQPQKQ